MKKTIETETAIITIHGIKDKEWFEQEWEKGNPQLKLIAATAYEMVKKGAKKNEEM
jgi:hypothetical protein